MRKNIKKKVISMTLVSLLILLYNNCGGFQSIELASIDTGIITAQDQKFQCTSPSERGVKANMGGRKLNFSELRLTLKSLFGDSVINQIQSYINLYPNDIGGFSADMTIAEMNAIERIAFGIPDVILSQRNLAAVHIPNCLFENQNGVSFKLTDVNCNRSFIKNLGHKIHRRPLNTEEENLYLALLTTVGNEPSLTNVEKVASVFTTMLLNPNFTMQLSYLANTGTKRSKVDDYTIASRLSYAASGTMPDENLMQAAQQGSLQSESVRSSHAKRLLNSESARDHVRYMFTNYFNFTTTSALNSDYGEHIGVTTNLGLVQELKKETLDFIEYIIFEAEGSYQDLMLSDAAFPKSNQAVKILDANGISSGIRDPKKPGDGRKGLFMKPAMMMYDDARTSPIKRGYIFNKQALCLEIPQPTEAQVSAGEKLAEEIDPLLVSASEYAEHITSAQGCVACHGYINPPGHAFESFGPFGDYRNSEPIFNFKGEYLRDLPLQKVYDFIVDEQPRTVASTNEMIDEVVSSQQGQSCFAQQVFRFSMQTDEERSSHCHLSELEKMIRNKDSILNILTQNASSEDLIWQK